MALTTHYSRLATINVQSYKFSSNKKSIDNTKLSILFLFFQCNRLNNYAFLQYSSDTVNFLRP